MESLRSINFLIMLLVIKSHTITHPCAQIRRIKLFSTNNFHGDSTFKDLGDEFKALEISLNMYGE